MASVFVHTISLSPSINRCCKIHHLLNFCKKNPYTKHLWGMAMTYRIMQLQHSDSLLTVISHLSSGSNANYSSYLIPRRLGIDLYNKLEIANNFLIQLFKKKFSVGILRL